MPGGCPLGSSLVSNGRLTRRRSRRRPRCCGPSCAAPSSSTATGSARSSAPPVLLKRENRQLDPLLQGARGLPPDQRADRRRAGPRRGLRERRQPRPGPGVELRAAGRATAASTCPATRRARSASGSSRWARGGSSSIVEGSSYDVAGRRRPRRLRAHRRGLRPAVRRRPRRSPGRAPSRWSWSSQAGAAGAHRRRAARRRRPGRRARGLAARAAPARAHRRRRAAGRGEHDGGARRRRPGAAARGRHVRRRRRRRPGRRGDLPAGARPRRRGRHRRRGRGLHRDARPLPGRGDHRRARRSAGRALPCASWPAPSPPTRAVACIVSGGNNDVSRYGEIVERSLVHEGLRHYFLVSFPQEPGALRHFLDDVLGATARTSWSSTTSRRTTARPAGPGRDRARRRRRPRRAARPDGGQPADDRAGAAGLAAVHVPDVRSPISWRPPRRRPRCAGRRRPRCGAG